MAYTDIEKKVNDIISKKNEQIEALNKQIETEQANMATAIAEAEATVKSGDQKKYTEVQDAIRFNQSRLLMHEKIRESLTSKQAIDKTTFEDLINAIKHEQYKVRTEQREQIQNEVEAIKV